MPRFKIYRAPTDDVNQGWVRLGDCGLPHRSVVRLSARATSKHVYCEVLTLDENFIDDYNERKRTVKIGDRQSTIVVSEWYRKKLGIRETDAESEIDVKSANCFWGKLCACWDHPQVVVRIATWLGLLGCGLGLIAIALGLLPLLRNN